MEDNAAATGDDVCVVVAVALEIREEYAAKK